MGNVWPEKTNFQVFFRKPKMGGPLQNISCNVSIISQHHAIQRCILRCCKSQGHNPLVSIHQPVAWTTLVHFWTTIVQLLHGFVKVIYLFSKVVSCILSQYCQKQVKTRQMKLKLLIELNQTTPLDLLCFWNSFFSRPAGEQPNSTCKVLVLLTIEEAGPACLDYTREKCKLCTAKFKFWTEVCHLWLLCE